MGGLADAQLAGQRIVTSFRGTTLSRSLAGRIGHGEVAGVILFKENVTSTAQTRRLIADIQAVPRPPGLRAPLLVMIDQEGGRVRRLPGGPPAAASVTTPEQARAAGQTAGAALRAVGANVDLAPVADVGRAGGFLAGQRRTYPSAAEVVGFHQGLMDRGILGAAKHFPGLGAAAVNTDLAPSAIRVSRETLIATDEAPFRALISDGIKLVMVASAAYPALDPKPAVFSKTVVTGELRGRLGFQGVVMTDSLNAGALRPVGGPGPSSVRAAAAGVDLMLVTSERAATDVQRSLIHAYRTGTLRRDRARTSVQRITGLRAGLPTPVPPGG